MTRPSLAGIEQRAERSPMSTWTAVPALTAAPSATREEVHTITLTPIDVDHEALAAYFEGVTDEVVLRVRRNPTPKEDR